MAKKIWLIIAGIALVMAGMCIGKSLYDTYHDRPFVDGLQYVGRDYNSGCISFRLLCTSPETEELYYATDINPEEIVKLFPGWTIEETRQGGYQLRDGGSSTAHGYSLIYPATGQYSGYEYVEDKSAASAASHLLPTQKKYIIAVRREDYDILRQSLHS